MQLNALLKPIKLSAAIGLVGLLTACSGNSSSTTTGPAAVVDPVVIDKTMAEVEWTAANYATNASHAYRVITKSSMLRYVFTNRLAEFDILVSLLRVNTNRDCNISGRMVATMIGDICYDADGDKETCDNSPITENTQKSQAIACQDGSVAGQYFDGFFNTTARTDLTVANENRTSTTIFAVDTAPTFDKNGDQIFDEHGNPVLADFTDYLFQSDISTFFFDHQYESYVDFDTDGPDNIADLAACTDEKTSYVKQQGMRSDMVGTQEGDGVSNFYLYTQLTDLNLKSTPSYYCDGDIIKANYAYSLETTMANAAMGGGTDRNTVATWPDMDISVEKDSSGVFRNEPSGIMTLVHENSTGNYSVVVNFNVDGQVTLTPSIGAPSTLTLSEFLALSEPVTPVE